MKSKQVLMEHLKNLLNMTEEWTIEDIEYQSRDYEEYAIITQPGDYKIVVNITDDTFKDIIIDLIGGLDYGKCEDYDRWTKRMNIDIELEDEIDEMLELLDKEVYTNEV